MMDKKKKKERKPRIRFVVNGIIHHRDRLKTNLKIK
jgi:hypothetical protein